jgi:hypothetical protein
VWNVILKMWSFPSTAVGLVWGGIGWLFGAKVSIGNNAIQFVDHPFMCWGCIALGNTIHYKAGMGPGQPGDCTDHERQHTYQAEVLGWAYLPAHLICGLLSLVTSGDWHHNNPLEWGPDADQPIGAWRACNTWRSPASQRRPWPSAEQFQERWNEFAS